MLITFPLQQWLPERASIIRYAYVACHGLSLSHRLTEVLYEPILFRTPIVQRSVLDRIGM